MVREIKENELFDLLELYLNLHESSVPKMTEHLKSVWDTIINDNNHHIIVNEQDGKIVSSCVCVIIPNLTRNVRPYAFVENVVTHSDYRGKGYATDCLNYAKELAKKAECYKMMLLTGSKEDSTLNFYTKAGYNSTDKTAFIQWLDSLCNSIVRTKIIL
nr:GNAT family N-acetyltransferase [Ruminococcus sp.]